MGWFISKIGQMKLLWHTGTLPHFGAYMTFLPEQDKGIVLLFNACHHWYNPVQAELGAGVAALLAGEQSAPGPFIRMVPGRCVASCSFRSSRLEASSPRRASYAAGAWSLSTARAVDARGGFMCCSR